MNRRDMMCKTAAAGAALGLLRLARNEGAEPAVAASLSGRSSALDPTDRRQTRDPMAVQKATLVVDGLDTSVITERYVGMLRTGGVNCIYRSMGVLQDFADQLNFMDAHAKDLALVRNIKEIRQAHQDGKIGVIMGWQSATGLGVEQLNPFSGPPRTPLRAYYAMGLRVLGIAYNIANQFGAGNMEPNLGLTRTGRKLVEEIHHLNILLDVGGHTGEQTSLDAIAMTSGRPVICSHTNIAAIADNPRNVSDRVIDAIAKTGGVIGITPVNDFHVRTKKDMAVAHSPRIRIEKMLDQYEYLKKRVGVDHIGIGTDFVEGRRIDYDVVNRSSTINREIISDGPWLYVQGFETIADLPNVTRGLIQRGWPTADIHKVLGGNWLRVYERVWG